MFDPATKKVVFDEIEDDTLPPFVSISFLISSLEKFEKTPETTKDLPSSIEETFLAESSISNWMLWFFKELIISMFCSFWENSIILFAIFSPISSTEINSSKSEFKILSMFSKCFANFFATVSPTYLIPNPYNTLSKGIFLESKIPLIKLFALFSAILSKPTIWSNLKSYKSE